MKAVCAGTTCSLEKRLTPNKDKQLLRLLGRLTGTGIIYAKTRSSCESISHYISENGLHSTFFHAGLDLKEKNERQQNWLDNKVPIMVSTTAFGMGIDKADVMWVIHWDAPDTIEGYYQEVGRGGRGGPIISSVPIIQSARFRAHFKRNHRSS